jgi:DNA-binding transcriptional MerR regulator
MRVSELVRASGMPLATIKYYLREGLLMPGTATAATQAEYGDEHVRRLQLIRALTEVAGLSVQRTREVLRVIDEPETDLFESLGRAVAALPPYAEPREDYPRARWALERLGQLYDPRYAAVAQLERSLEAAENAGLPLGEERLLAYGRSIMAIAEVDLDAVPDGHARAIEYSVLGTAIYEPVLAALRRLAHQDLAARRLSESNSPS